jgi:hypothetical protein
MQTKNRNDSTEVSFTIAASAADGRSETLNLGTARAWAIQMPAAWTNAALTLRASSDGVTWADVYKAGSEYSIDAQPSRYIILGNDLIGAQFVQFRSGTTGTPVQQAADRALKLICHTRLL